jgi:hypothetical protein
VNRLKNNGLKEQMMRVTITEEEGNLNFTHLYNTLLCTYLGNIFLPGKKRKP